MRSQTESKRRWEVFQGFPNRVARDGPRVTLNSKKIFLVNTAAFAAMGEPVAVEFRYDENTRTIGLTPTDPRRKNAFPLHAKKNREKYKYRVIYAAAFCKHHGIDLRRTVLFIDVDMDNDGTLMLELNTAVTVGRGMR